MQSAAGTKNPSSNICVYWPAVVDGPPMAASCSNSGRDSFRLLF